MKYLKAWQWEYLEWKPGKPGYEEGPETEQYRPYPPMNKKEFIEKYGEEAWEVEKKERALESSRRWKREHREQNRERDKQYKLAHKEHISAQGKIYRQEHKEEIIEYRKKYYIENVDRIKEWHKVYNERNRDTILARKKRYRENNKGPIAEYQKEWRKRNPGYIANYLKEYYIKHPEVAERNRNKTKEYYKKNYYTKESRSNYLVNAYSSIDKKAGRGECTLTRDWIINNIFNSSCIYCGDSDWRHLGCDRIENNLPHTPENCVCSCGICNIERADRFTVSEFVEYRKTHPRELNRNHRIEVVNGSLKKRNFV